MIKPPKPTLHPVKNEQGGVCFDRVDSTKLGTYILDLEKGYE